ncbi:MAG: TetR/AcrR family transcriptional regulator [Pseudomonadota bacterium]
MPKTVDPIEKRAEFVAASWNVIAERGFDAISLRSVAAAAGCTTGALTHYFSDRNTLLIEALIAAHTGAANRMAKVAKTSDSDFQRLRAVLLESLPLDDERLREWRVWLAFWGASINNAALASENKKRYAEWQSLIQELLMPLSKNVEADAELIVALVDGLGLNIARHTDGNASLTRQQSKCRAVLDHVLSQFRN